MGQRNDQQIPIVLLHGVGLDRTMWGRLQNELPYGSLALDLPGHGEQPNLRGEVNLVDLADDVLKRIPYQKYYLLGFSLGALIAQQIAAQNGAGLQGLICVSSVCQRTAAERESVLGRLDTARNKFEDSVRASIKRWYPQGTDISEEEIRHTEDVLLGNDVESYLLAYNVFATGDEQIAPALPTIQAPVLVITGEDDPGSTPQMSRRLAAALPDATLTIVPDARHMFPVTHARVLADAMTSFIQQVESR